MWQCYVYLWPLVDGDQKSYLKLLCYTLGTTTKKVAAGKDYRQERCKVIFIVWGSELQFRNRPGFLTKLIWSFNQFSCSLASIFCSLRFYKFFLFDEIAVVTTLIVRNRRWLFSLNDILKRYLFYSLLFLESLVIWACWVHVCCTILIRYFVEGLSGRCQSGLLTRATTVKVVVDLHTDLDSHSTLSF